MANALFERGAFRAATMQLDHRQAGDAGDRQAGAGVLLDRGVADDADARPYGAWIVRVEAEADHIADLDAAVLHGAALGQPGHRLVEDHLVVGEGAIGAAAEKIKIKEK